MNRLRISLLFTPLSFIVLYSCNKTSINESYSDEVFAFVDSIPITVDQVDNKIKQEIYDELNRVYIIRKIALEETIKEKILSLEASKYNLPLIDLLDSIYSKTDNIKLLQEYILINKFDKGIPSFERTLQYYDINSKKGNEILITRFRESILKSYIDSLKTIYKINILLKPPIPPDFQIERLSTHFKGNIKSEITFLVISDFECSMCREFNPIFDSIFFKYKDKVRFGFLNFGSYVTISSLASESAALQGKFWEMHDSLFLSPTFIDTAAIFRIAKNINLDINIFKRDFYSENLKNSIQNNLITILNLGIYATPTILINDKPVFNSSSFSEIENRLKEEFLISR